MNDLNNIIIGDPILENSTIDFKGTGNILYCEVDDDGKPVTIKNSKIEFLGDNSVIYLSSNRHTYFLKVDIIHDSVLYFGKDNYMNKRLNIIVTEQKHVIIGDDGLFAFGCWLRTSDPHIVYDVESKKRINMSRSIFLGDHIWAGQEAVFLKGTECGSGVIIGARAVVSGKKLHSNAAFAGNPVKCVTENVFHLKDSVRKYKKSHTKKSMECKRDEFIYEYDVNKTLSFKEIEKQIEALKTSEERLEFLKTYFGENKNSRYRFYIAKKQEKSLSRKIFKR